MIALVAMVALVAIGSFGCGNDTPGQANCSSHDDCELGSVCGADDQCVQTKCSFCADDPELICLETDANPQGTCSKPECSSNSECPKPGESCIEGQCLGSECSDDDDCDQTAGEICSAFNQCIIPDDTDTGFPEDSGTDSGVDSGSPDTGSPDTGVPDDTGMTDDAGTDGGGSCGECADGKVCDPEKGMCVETNCPEKKDCSGNPTDNVWNPLYCACAQCIKNNGDCPSGEVCTGGVCKPPCETECSNGDASMCPMGQDFCISDCCQECIGNKDCDGDKVCVDGICSIGSPNNCTPGNCPSGYSCNTSSGQCEQEQSNMMCSSQNPMSCPSGEFCNPQTQQCEAVSGGQQCGLCGSNCKCPGKLTCDQFFCTGCSQQVIGGDPDYACPSGQSCLPLGNLTGPDPGNICF